MPPSPRCKQIGEKTFAKNQRVVVITVPGKKVTEDVPRSPEDTDANVKIVNPYTPQFEAQQDWRKTPPAPGKQPELNLPVPTTFALSNGTKVYLLEEHSLPVFSAKLVDLAGSAMNPKDQAGLAGFTARMLTEGTAKRSSTLLADDVASIGASSTQPPAWTRLPSASTRSATTSTRPSTCSPT